ncbi:MAG: tetratricopeptide repeat protein [Candidatus Omnitrophota bacterium]
MNNRFMKMTTPIWQKIAPVLLGLILSLALLEAGLRLGGFIFSSIQAYENFQSTKQKGTYRILCLGESTTQRQYPHLLEKVLNQRNIGVRFSVIDKGRAVMNTITLLEGIESNLAEYRPDMVVAMMGINDQGTKYYHTIPKSDTWLFRHCRTYRFGRILFMHILKKIKREDIDGSNKVDSKRKARPKNAATVSKKAYLSNETSVKKVTQLNLKDAKGTYGPRSPSLSRSGFAETEESLKKAIELNPENDKAYVALGWLYRDQNRLIEAEASLKKAIELNPKNENAHVDLGGLYKNQGKFHQAEDCYKKVIEINPGNDNTYVEFGWLYRVQGNFILAEAFFRKALELNPKNEHACNRLGWLYSDQGKFALAEDFYKKAVALDPKNDNSYFALGVLYRDHSRLSQAEDSFRRAFEINPDNERALGAMSSLYEQMGKPELAKEYAERANGLRSEECSAVTVNNYRKLKDILDRKGIKLVCVQYPVRNVEPLKRIFEKDKGVIFVDNERVFKDALRKGSYKEYFKDMFAGDFGHCTRKGNMLLAQNIADVILKEVFNKE